MFIRNTAIIALVAIGLGGAAQAATINVGFPSTSSTSVSTTGGTFFFTAGDFVEETFNDTGIFDLESLDFGINLDDNVLNSGAFVDFDVLVNGTTVGAFTINDGDGLGQFDFSFGFTDTDLGNDDYTLRFEVTNTVASGEGSVSFATQDSFVALKGNMAAIPLPAGLPLLLAAVGVLGLVRRRA